MRLFRRLAYSSLTGMGIFMLLTSSSFAAENCFYRHLKDAIELNLTRRPLYARLSQGRSTFVSDLLIGSEAATLPVALLVDLRATPFREKGVPLLCDDFASMSETPDFRDSAPATWLDQLEPVSGKEIRSRASTAYRSSGFEGLASVIESELHSLAEYPEYHCMTRHLLESAYRAARLAPLYARRAEKNAACSSPEEISHEFIQSQLLALEWANWLDQKAFPIQRDGIPIICQDVPRITESLDAALDRNR